MYPLSIRDVSPTPDAVRLTGVRPDGRPDGFHTGGAWLVGDDVWKPLDGRPWANCEEQYPTQEAECLEAMADQPLFPRNWRIEEANGRRFLVRKKAKIINDFTILDLKQVLQVEQAMHSLNAAGWQIGDDISLGIDRQLRQLFIVDLSNAMQSTTADDQWRIEIFFRQAGRESLANFRRNAHEAICGLEYWDTIPEGYGHIYASFNRPIDAMWARIPDAVYIHTMGADRHEGVPHTWVACKSPLSEEVLHKYELQWGWSPTR